jgi:histidinol-phosphate/aromatic aminotransferase/cobyric acid decarboxylase-like protein
MRATDPLDTARRVLRHLRRRGSLSAFQIPPNRDVRVGTYRMAPLGSLTLLSIPGVPPPDPGSRAYLAGILSRGAERLKGRRLVEIGSGAGWIPVALARFAGARRVAALDLDDASMVVARINSILNGVEGRVVPMNGATGQLFEADAILVNVPLVAPGAGGPFRALAGYSDPVPEDLRPLERAASTLESALPSLREGGSVFVSFSAGPTADALRWLFARWGLLGRGIHRERVQLDAMAPLEPLARAERESGRRFRFYDMFTAVHPVGAQAAAARAAVGDPVWHDLRILHGRRYRDALARLARPSVSQISPLTTDPVPGLAEAVACYLRGYLRVQAEGSSISIAPSMADLRAAVDLTAVPAASLRRPGPMRRVDGAAIDLGAHLQIPQVRLAAAVSKSRPEVPPAPALEQAAVRELLRALARGRRAETPEPPRGEPIRLDRAESEWPVPASTRRGARRTAAPRELQEEAARWMSRSRRERIRADEIVTGCGVTALIGAALAALRTQKFFIPIPRPAPMAALAPWTLVLTRRVGDELAIELPEGRGALLVAQPNSPTGLFYSEAACRAISESGFVVLVDESFAGLGGGYRPIRADVRLAGMSKEFGLAGLRVGFAAVGDPALRRSIRRRLSREPDPWSAGAAMETLRHGEKVLGLHREWLEPRRLALERTLKDLGIPFVPPSAGLAMWVDFDAVWPGRVWDGRDWRGKRISRARRVNRENLTEMLRTAAGVAVNPPGWSGVEAGPYRVAFCVERLPEALERLRSFAARLQ